MSWRCNCGLINTGIIVNEKSISSRLCAGINQAVIGIRLEEHFQVTPNSLDYLMSYVARKELMHLMSREMTEQEQLFAKFFSEEKTLIALMTREERIDHIQQLEEIAFEAKARLTAGKEYEREENARSRAKGKWTITETNPDQTVTDTINKVKLRKDRMTKLDRQSAKLAALGFSPAEVEAMVAGLRKSAMKDEPEEREKKVKQVIAVQDTSKIASAASEPGVISPINNPVPEIDTTPVDLTKLRF